MFERTVLDEIVLKFFNALIGVFLTVRNPVFRGQKKADAYGWVSPESPPPRPPHCPESPELVDIRLANGEYADVRIIQFGDARLYVRTKWLVSLLIDHIVAKYHLGDETESPDRKASLAGLLGLFQPDIYQDECPGVV
ncbi:MAG: hypothetical protein P8Y48_14995, partial [Novosphingobium sp.]